jgi:hypothetical protein
VPPESLGRLLGAIGLLHALSRVIAPILFNGLYMATVDTFPQAFFVLMFALFVVVLVATLLVRPHGKSSYDPQSVFLIVLLTAHVTISLFT